MDSLEADALGQLMSSSGITDFDDSAIEALKFVADGAGSSVLSAAGSGGAPIALSPLPRSLRSRKAATA